MRQLKHCTSCLEWYEYDDERMVQCAVNHRHPLNGCCHYGEVHIQEPETKVLT